MAMGQSRMSTWLLIAAVAIAAVALAVALTGRGRQVGIERIPRRQPAARRTGAADRLRQARRQRRHRPV